MASPRPANPTKREVRRAALTERIEHFFIRSGRIYGSPRITLGLWAEGWQVSVNTVAGIMAERGWYGREPKKRRNLTRQGKRPAARDLVGRHFDAIAPDVLWVGDMTETDTGEGKLYLATVIDLFSRRCLGYAMDAHHDAALVSASLQMAAASRGGDVGGVIFHSDRGSEYTSAAYNSLCDRLCVVQSMGRVGSCFDNAAAEAFNSTVKTEYVHRHRSTTRAEARLKIATWIADFYNTRRRHTRADGLPPAEFERMISQQRHQAHHRAQAA